MKLYFQLLIEAWSRPSYVIKKAAIIILCVLHDFTKYHTAKTVWDLFYWPNGLCIDMVVVAAFFIVGLLSLWDDSKIIDQALYISRFEDDEFRGL